MSRIYLKGEVQTRSCHWHDFFNMLIWCTFPKIKARLNQLQFQELARRKDCKQRSPLENFLTLLDENGIIIISSNNFLLQLIRDMQWKQLFWQHRCLLAQQLKCFVIGHSTHEKLLQPYIGMVSHGLLFSVEEDFFKRSSSEQIDHIEQEFLQLDLETMTSRSLFPIPILGFPNWCEAAQSEQFYDNQAYFRMGRRAVIP